MKKFETKYGYFADDGKEYVITDFRTPRPWVNVISNGYYGLVVSQLNGGFSWVDNSNLNRLTRWSQDLISDNWGKYIYFRDDESGEFWSPTVRPVMKEPDAYECRHGTGYTIFKTINYNIQSTLRIFVPRNHNLEIWTLSLRNLDRKPRRISIYTYFEWCLGAAPDHHREFHKTFLETNFDKDHQIQFAKKRLWEVPTDKGHWNMDWPWTAYFACSENVHGYEGEKELFIGKYRGLENPQALETGQLSGSQSKWNDSIASLKKVINLESLQKSELHFFLGAEEDENLIIDQINYYRNTTNIEKEFDVSNKYWENILNLTSVETPDESFNIMTNIWLKYQAISGRIWGRAGFYQQSGAYGFRDQLQDSQIFLYNEPELTRKQLILHAAHQFSDGRVLHWWHSLSDKGLDAGMSDDLLWLPFVLIQYLKETADWSILEVPVKYYESNKNDTLLAHCLLAIDLSLKRYSPRGLPLILAGDWNDGLSAVGLEGKGESIWLAHFIYYILREITPVLEKAGQKETIIKYQDRAENLYQVINDYGWDGKWFIRATKDGGETIGSNKNKEGKIFLNAQTWAVIADSCDKKRKEMAINSAREMLDSKIGALLLSPAYTKPDPNIGYLSRYAPGLRENGGVYTHAATWMVWAASILTDP